MIPRIPNREATEEPVTKESLILALSNYIGAAPAANKAAIYNDDQDLLFEVGRAFEEHGYSFQVSNLPVTGNKYKLTIKW